MRRLLRKGIRKVRDGEPLPRPAPAANGLIPTMSGDVIVSVPKTNRDDDALQEEMGDKVGAIIVDTLPFPHGERQAEIERRVRAMLAT